MFVSQLISGKDRRPTFRDAYRTSCLGRVSWAEGVRDVPVFGTSPTLASSLDVESFAGVLDRAVKG